jgi:lysophospholipase L1-like esterase
MVASATRRFERYVALGDSSTEGLDDPDGRGGYRGWANRLAERIAASQSAQGGLLYANLAIRGRTTRQIRDQQLAPALAMRPDLATLFCGTNDVVGRGFDAERVAADVDAMQRALRAADATVLTFTLPDLAPVMPLARRLSPRLRNLNARLRAVAEANGALLVDFEAHPVAGDPRLWSDDRLHANADGHARIAAALAHALGLPGSDETWQQPLPPLLPVPRLARAGREISWHARHLVPWLWRHARGRSSGDGRRPKRPELRPVEVADCLGLCSIPSPAPAVVDRSGNSDEAS